VTCKQHLKKQKTREAHVTRYLANLRFKRHNLSQSGQESVDGLIGGLVGGADGEVGEAAVEGVAFLEALLGGSLVFEDGARYVLKHAAVEEGGEGCVKKDGEGGGGLFEEETVGEFFGSSAAEGEDGVVVAESGGEGGGFEAAEVGFAVALEELGNGGSGAGFEVGVEVEELPVEAGGEEAADGGLACSHEAGEDETAEMRGHGIGAGLIVGHVFCLGFRLSSDFGPGGRHYLSLLMVREK
jgi:hypothetical protein